MTEVASVSNHFAGDGFTVKLHRRGDRWSQTITTWV